MAILGASFQIGRSALAAYQAALAVAGQNIANAANPDYARQTGRLEALLGGPVLGGVAPGAGVALSQLRRHVDESLEARLRLSLGQRSGAETLSRTLNQVESLYNELSDQDLSTALSGFFTSFSQLQTEPTDATARNLVIAAADTAVRTLRRQRAGLLGQVTDLNRAATDATGRISQVADEIARLNQTIVQEQARGSGGENPLKDRRDALLRDLGELSDIEVRPQANGSVNVYVGGDPLVEFDRSRGLITELEQVDGLEIATVRFGDNNGAALIRGGQLGAIVEARDEHIRAQLDQLDDLARGLAYEVNRVHASGRGLVSYANLTGTYAVDDPAAALNTAAAGLDFPVENGTFLVHVRDPATGRTVTRQIDVDLDGIGGDTSLNSLAAALGGVPGLTASVTSDNRLSISAAAGQEVWFSEDSSGATASLGLTTFFTGVDAGTIDIRADVRSDPRLIAASLTGQSADGDNAGRLARIAETASALLGDRTIPDFQSAMVGDLAVRASAAQTQFESADAVYSSMVAQREALSGVSIDEEAINLTKYERAFQGASRFISVVDTLSGEILSLVQ